MNSLHVSRPRGPPLRSGLVKRFASVRDLKISASTPVPCASQRAALREQHLSSQPSAGVHTYLHPAFCRNWNSDCPSVVQPPGGGRCMCIEQQRIPLISRPPVAHKHDTVFFAPRHHTVNKCTTSRRTGYGRSSRDKISTTGRLSLSKSTPLLGRSRRSLPHNLIYDRSEPAPLSRYWLGRNYCTPQTSALIFSNPTCC